MSEAQAKEIILREYPEFKPNVEQREQDGRSIVELLSILESFY